MSGVGVAIKGEVKSAGSRGEGKDPRVKNEEERNERRFPNMVHLVLPPVNDI